MRIISGAAKGRKLKGVEGLDTRPTSDNVKESLFNIIQFDIEGRKVLDLFAGTGQLGLECLSRGAESCTFVELRRDAVSVIRENVAWCKLEEGASVVQGDYLAYLTRCSDPFHLILLDPPYDSGLLEKAIQTIVEIDILSENGIIVCESSREQEMPQVDARYSMGKQYQYGKKKLTLYHRGVDEK